MDKRQRLDELNKQDEKLLKDAEKLKKDIIIHDNYDEYEQCSSDEERRQKFPELYELYEQLQEIDEKRDAIIDEIDAIEAQIQQEDEANEKKQNYDEIKQKIEKLEMELKLNQAAHSSLNDECKARLMEITELKNSKAYKDGDVEVVKKVQELDNELNKKVLQRIALANGLKNKEKELKDLEKEIETYINEGKEKYKEVEDKIKEAKAAQIKRYNDYVKLIADYDKEYEDKSAEIDTLKNSQAYKDGDEETLKKVEALQADLKEIDSKKSEAGKNLNEKAKETSKIVKDLEKQKEQFIQKYGDSIIPVVQEITPANNERKSNNKEQEVGDSEEVSDKDEKGSNSTAERKTGRKTVGKNERNNDNGDVSNLPLYSDVAVSQPTENHKEKMLQEQFNKLYVKAKKGDLSQEDFDELSEIMQDPSKYDELGITTGRVFNKAKVIFKAMAARAAKNASTIKLCEEKIGIKYQKPSEETGLLSSSSLKEWKGLKVLLNDPESKIASEELFKKVVSLDRDLLDDEQKAVWDAAKEHLGRIQGIRAALKAYDSVTKQREQTKVSWFSGLKKETPKPLSAPSPQTKTGGISLGEMLASQIVGENEQPTHISASTKTKPTVTRNDR